VTFYITHYPISRTAQGPEILLPSGPVQSNTVSASLGSIQPWCPYAFY